MELHQHSFLEELTVPTASVNEFFATDWSFNTDLAASDPPFSGLVLSPTDIPPFGSPLNESFTFVDGYTLQDIYSSHNRNSNNNNNGISTPPFPIQQDYTPMVEDGQIIGLLGNHLCCCNFEEIKGNRSHEAEREESVAVNMPISNTAAGLRGERKNGVKKLEGQPSKNLMAERRRRKRLNDRLSMLRSIVPKISKMDRTSILGDTIDYMKELLEKINKIQDHQEDIDKGVDQKNLMGHFKELKPNQIIVRNPPKFDVDRRNLDTRIEICCAARPGLLLSTLSTLEALGLDIQQCVISCFNDFSLQASCSEVVEHSSIISCEEVKQELFRNAGYGGRCL